MNYTYTVRMGKGLDNMTDGQRHNYSMARQLMRDWAMDNCGGFTSRNVMGGWRDDCTEVAYYEGVWECTFDDVDNNVDIDDLKATLSRMRELSGEQCIYLNCFTFSFIIGNDLLNF